METAEKQRFELLAGRIRALYVHSAAHRLRRVSAKPPVTLFHGTSPKVIKTILAEGLLPQGRQYAHLSVDRDVAFHVGRRKDRHPTILEVAAAEAHSSGTVFYEGNEQVWLEASTDGVGTRPSTEPVKPGDQGTDGDLKTQKRKHGETELLDMDHRPSYAAQKKALEDKLGRELTPEEAKTLKKTRRPLPPPGRITSRIAVPPVAQQQGPD